MSRAISCGRCCAARRWTCVDERVVGVGQQLGCEARQVVEVAVEDRPGEAGLGHERADGQLRERALGEQRAGGAEDPLAGEVGGDVGRTS